MRWLLIVFLLISLRIVWVFYQRSIIRKNLFQVIEVFNKNGVDYWVDFGSLLGFQREGDIILGDGDGDIVVLNRDERFDKSVKELGLKYQSWGAHRKFFFGIIYIDIYHAKKNGDKLLIPDNGDIRYDLIYPLKKCRVQNIEYNCPANVEGVLETRYGKDWKISNHKFATLYI